MASKQTTLNFARLPLGAIDGNRKRKLSQSPPPPPSPAPAESHWTLEIPKSRWKAAVERLIEGYEDKSGSSYGPATTNSTKCTLGQKGANRADNGYLQVSYYILHITE